MCPSLIEIRSKTAEKNSAQTNKQTSEQTNRQTDRHYENNGHLAVNQKWKLDILYRDFGNEFPPICHYCGVMAA